MPFKSLYLFFYNFFYILRINFPISLFFLFPIEKLLFEFPALNSSLLSKEFF